MWLYGSLIHIVLILNCRAREDGLDYFDQALSKVIHNITEINKDLLHFIRNAHKSLGDMKKAEILTRDDRNEIKSGLKNHDKNQRLTNDLLEYLTSAIETISSNPRTRLNVLDVLRNTLQLYKHAILEIHLKSDATSKKIFEYDDDIKKRKLKDIWKTLLIKLKSLLQNENDYASVKSSEEDKKPMIIVLTNLDNTDINEDDRSDTNESQSNEKRAKAVLRDGCVTCVKSQVKKCYKALKDCTKRSCATYNCKSSFKRSFKTNSKKGCVAEFWKDDNNKIGGKRNNVSVAIYVNHPDKPRYTRNLVDLDFGCKDEKESVYPSSLDQLINPITPASARVRTVNILRDKYDKACKRAVAKKCNKVCANVITKTCTEHKCMKKQIKSLKKDCKNSCAIAFGVPKSGGDSSDSSDEEDEEDEEDESESD